jgi:maltooligosyltrehalose trehalohydrolase
MAANEHGLADQHQTSLGANVVRGGVDFSVWAPKAREVAVELVRADGTECLSLEPRGGGLFGRYVPGVSEGVRYRFRLDGGGSYPDPWSRYQPEGIHGPSEVVDVARFPWSDSAWRGIAPERLVLYEVHVGTCTPCGTFDGVVDLLPELRDLGITAIELMPVAEFPGRWNWGYDGVFLFAPSHMYGGPRAFQRLVDAAHRHGLGVVLDVVYNHLGPDGNYLAVYSDDYVTDRYHTPWGDALNFDGAGAARVREMVIENARYWLRYFHVDGLRLDAVHTIHDASCPHILAEVTAACRAAAGADRQIFLCAESEASDPRLLRPVALGGFGFDAIWADDFHHAVHVLLTGEREGYYRHYDGTLRTVAAVIERRVLAGVRSGGISREEGGYANYPPASCVICLQNHDQVGNRALGERLHHLVDPEMYAVASCLFLLLPSIPLLFMGQEFATTSPFLYFTDHRPELGCLVTEGRRREFAAFRAFADPSARSRIPDPQAVETFLRSRLNLAERDQHAGLLRLYRILLQLRTRDKVFSRSTAGLAAVALDDHCILIRRWVEGDERIILANFGAERQVRLRTRLARPWKTLGWTILLATDESRFRLPHRGSSEETVQWSADDDQSAAVPIGTGARLEASWRGRVVVHLPVRTAVVLAYGPESGGPWEHRSVRRRGLPGYGDPAERRR